MFNLMKLAMHFSHMSYGALDPLVLELIRTENAMRARSEQEKQAPRAVDAPANDSEADLKDAA